MCGIAGVFSYKSSQPVDRKELLTIRDSMAMRGPDGDGIWFSEDKRCGLAHRRLAIIGLGPSGSQPMASADGRFVITFNGEIYNYLELRKELEGKGHVFVSTTDTEVLLHLYREHGREMVHALRGMYAFAIWDDHEGTLFLARDAFGIKPLYYADIGGAVRFASQVRALLAGGGLRTTPDAAGHVGFFVLGSVPEPFTLYRDIRALPAGHTLLVRRDGDSSMHRFFDVATEMARASEQAKPLFGEERKAYLTAELRESVRMHMVSDVPVGLFLSSGLDSTTIAALATELSSNLHSLTLGFDEYRGTANDEVPLAALTAANLRTNHQTRWVGEEEFERDLDHLMAAMDQPSIDGVNTFFVSKAAAERGMKVALSGLGGDELFGGYPSFADVPRIERTFRWTRNSPWMGRAIRRILAPVLQPFISPKYASLAEFGGDFAGAYLLRRALYMPWEVARFMDTAMFRDGWDQLDLIRRFRESGGRLIHNAQKVAALELSWYMRNQLLRDADWAGMAHSVEIRVPLVDAKLFRSVAPMLASPTPPSKFDLAESARHLIPDEILRRPKTGFSIPVHEWARKSGVVGASHGHLRNWAHIVYGPYRKMRALVLLSDAFGGNGGIALYNRDFISSLCAMDEIAEVVALPRIISRPLEPLPDKLRYETAAANSKLKYVWNTLKLLSLNRFDVVFCCHVNLLPLSLLAKWRLHVPVLMFIYGIDAWTPQSRMRTAMLRHVDRFISISEVTREKFCLWSRVNKQKVTVLPNAIHMDWYGAGPRSEALMARYRLQGKRVLMTLGRLVSSERYKGFDEVLEAMPALLAEIPDLVYMVVGDGTDRDRLDRKVTQLGLRQHVIFTGLISEAEKADHYRLADAYVMPSRGEGFGFVLLEAMACGIPSLGSTADGTREALRNGQLGTIVNPDRPEELVAGIKRALQQTTRQPPEGLEMFDFPNFVARTHNLVRQFARRSAEAAEEHAPDVQRRI